MSTNTILTLSRSASMGTDTADVGNQSQNHNDFERQRICANIRDIGSSVMIIDSQTTTMNSGNLGTSVPFSLDNHDCESQQHQLQKSTTKLIAESETATMMNTSVARVRTIRRRRKVRDFNEVISCYLCHGYLINATTIDYCVHSFCRSCIVKHLQKDKHCPICKSGSKQINLSNLRSDERLKSLVYKIVPGLYQNERQRQVQFYAEYNANKGENSEEIVFCDSEEDYFSPVEPVSLSLEYHPKSLKGCNKQQTPPIRYLQCPAAVTVHHLKRFIYSKFDIDPNNQRINIDIIYDEEILPDDFSLMDVGYCYCWKRITPMRFFYRILIQNLCNKPIQINNSDNALCESDNTIEAKNFNKAEEAGTLKNVRFKNISEELKSEKTNTIVREEIISQHTVKETCQTKYTILKSKMSKIEQKKQPVVNYFNNNNVERKIKDDEEKISEDSQINGGKGPVKVTIIARKSNELKVKCGKHENNSINHNTYRNKNKMKSLSAKRENVVSPMKNDFKCLRSNDIRYISSYTNNNTLNLTSLNKHKLSTAKPKIATEFSKSDRDIKQRPVSKCDIVVSIPQSHVHRSSNSSDDSFENLSLAQLKTANKKINTNSISAEIPSTIVSESTQNSNTENVLTQVKSENKLDLDIPKLKVELPSLKTKITVPKKSPEIRELKKNQKIRKHSIEEIPNPITSQVDLTTYAKNIGLRPINVKPEDKKPVKIKISPDNSPTSSLSSSPPSSVGSGFTFTTDPAVSSTHKKRKKAKHSKESKDSGSSKRRKLHAEIASQPAEESLKLKVKITANHKSYKAKRKISSCSNDDVIITSSTSANNSASESGIVTNAVTEKKDSSKPVITNSSTVNLSQNNIGERPKQNISTDLKDKCPNEKCVSSLIVENSGEKTPEIVSTQTVQVTLQNIQNKTRMNQSITTTANSANATATAKTNALNSVSQLASPTHTVVTNNAASGFLKATVSTSSGSSSTPLTLFSVSNSTQQASPKTLPPKVLSMQESKIPISPPLPPSLFKTTPMSLQTVTTTQVKSQGSSIIKVSSANDARSLAMSQLSRLTKVSTTKPSVSFAIPNVPQSTNSPKLLPIVSIACAANKQVAQLKRSASLDDTPSTLAKQQKLEQDQLIKKPINVPFLSQAATTNLNNLQTLSTAKAQKSRISVTCTSNNVRLTEPVYYTSTIAPTYTHDILTRKSLPVLLTSSPTNVNKISDNSNKITQSLGVTITPQQQNSPLLQQPQKPALEIVRISSSIPPIDQQPITVTSNNTVKPNPPKTTRPPPPPIPLVKIKRSNTQTPLKPTLTTINSSVQQAQLMHQNPSNTSSQSSLNKNTTHSLATSTHSVKSADNSETNKNPMCDNIGALDLSGKSSRSPSHEKSPLSTPPHTPTQQVPKENTSNFLMNKAAVSSLEAAVNKLKQQNQFAVVRTANSPTATTNIMTFSEKTITSNANDLTETTNTNNINTIARIVDSEATSTENAQNQQKPANLVSSLISAKIMKDLKMASDSTTSDKITKSQNQLPLMPKLNEISKMRNSTTVRQQNASVRNIPNPSALAFRSHQPIPMLTSITNCKLNSSVKSTSTAVIPVTTSTIKTTSSLSITTSQSQISHTHNTATKPDLLKLSGSEENSLEISSSSSNETNVKQDSPSTTTASDSSLIPVAENTSTSVMVSNGITSTATTTPSSNTVSSTNTTSSPGTTSSSTTTNTTTVTSAGLDTAKQAATTTTTTTAKKNLNIDQLAANLRAAVAADNSLSSIKSASTTITTPSTSAAPIMSVAKTTTTTTATVVSIESTTLIAQTTATTSHPHATTTVSSTPQIADTRNETTTTVSEAVPTTEFTVKTTPSLVSTGSSVTSSLAN